MRKKKSMAIGILAMAATAALMTACGNGGEKIQQTESAAVSASEEKKTETTGESASAGTVSESTEAENGAQTEEAKRISPLPATLSLDDLKDATFAASIQTSGVTMENGTLSVRMIVYDYELFDMAEISQLKEGDTLVCNGEDMLVTFVERGDGGMVTVNGGLEEGGCYLATNGDGVYYESGFDDMKSYYSIGETVLEAAPDFVFVDRSDIESQSEKTMNAEEFAEFVKMQDDNAFLPTGTQVRTENGKIAEIDKNYTP